MKLRNKKTGEIIDIYKGEITLHYDQGKKTIHFKRLEELEEWEDAPEDSVKPYWFINDLDGEPMKCDLKNCGKSNFTEWRKHRKEIGNYFETKEEAELALRKLKAIKILKDNGFRFIQWEFDMRTIADGKIWFDVGVNTQWDAEQLLKHRSEVKESLDLLFGGEE